MPNDVSVISVKLPVLHNLKGRNAWRSTPIWSGHATRIQEEDAVFFLAARDMVCACRRTSTSGGEERLGRYGQAKANPVANEINHRGHSEIAIAIPAHQGNRRAQALQPNEQARRAKVTEMPDLVRAVNQSLEIFRQMIMGIGEDKNAKRRHFLFLHQLVRRNKENFARNPHNLCVRKEGH